MSPAVHEAEAIIHTATLPVPSHPNKWYLNNLRQAQKATVSSLIKAARSCRVFVYTSGMTVYGIGNDPKTKTTEIDPVELAKPYVPEKRLAIGLSKLGTSKATALGAYAYALSQL